MATETPITLTLDDMDGLEHLPREFVLIGWIAKGVVALLKVQCLIAGAPGGNKDVLILSKKDSAKVRPLIGLPAGSKGGNYVMQVPTAPEAPTC